MKTNEFGTYINTDIILLFYLYLVEADIFVCITYLFKRRGHRNTIFFLNNHKTGSSLIRHS